MTTVSIHEAKAKLSELIHGLAPGDEVLITENNQPIARIVPAPATGMPRQLGTMRGTVIHMDPDFDAPLEDFKDYLS